MVKSKRLFFILLSSCIFFSMPISAHANDSIRIFINGTALETTVSPVLVNERVMVPVRDIAECPGIDCVVSWDDINQTVTLNRRDGWRAELKIDSNKATKYLYQWDDSKWMSIRQQEETLYLDCPPKIIEDKTMVPIRFVGEFFNFAVSWIEETKQVDIYNKDIYTPVPIEAPSTPNSFEFEYDIRRRMEIRPLTEATSYKLACAKNEFNYDAVMRGGMVDTLVHVSGTVLYADNTSILLQYYSDEVIRIENTHGIGGISQGDKITVYGPVIGTSTYDSVNEWTGVITTLDCAHMWGNYIDCAFNLSGSVDTSDCSAELQLLYGNWQPTSFIKQKIYGNLIGIDPDYFDGRQYAITAAEKKVDSTGEEYLDMTLQILVDEPTQTCREYNVQLRYINNMMWKIYDPYKGIGYDPTSKEQDYFTKPEFAFD